MYSLDGDNLVEHFFVFWKWPFKEEGGATVVPNKYDLYIVFNKGVQNQKCEIQTLIING